MRSSYEAAGAFVDSVAGSNDRLLTGEVGMIGYRARRYTHDLAGIVSPEVLEIRRDAPTVPISVILKKLEPEFLVLDGLHLDRLWSRGDVEWVKMRYKVLASFEHHTVLGVTSFAPEQ
jgi:hypothetical protein